MTARRPLSGIGRCATPAIGFVTIRRTAAMWGDGPDPSPSTPGGERPRGRRPPRGRCDVPVAPCRQLHRYYSRMDGELVATFEQNGRTMVYTRSGTDTGTAFVLVHGIGMGHRVFRDLADELGRSGPVYAVDLPGFGDSPEPGSALDMPASGDFLAAFVASLPVRDPVLVGHSMGTQIVVETLVRHPELASRAVLIAPTVNPAERTARQQALRMLQDMADESPKVLALGTVQYVKAGPRWFLRKLRQMLDHHVEDVLPLLRARTLVLRGEDDLVCPRDWVRRVTELIPDAQMREIPARGHEAMIRSPQPVASMIIEHATDVDPGRAG